MAGLRASTRPPAPFPVAFTLDGHHMRLRERSGRWWLRRLSAEPPGCWFHIVPMGLPKVQADHLMGRLMDPSDAFDLDDVEGLAEDVVGRVVGMDMWAAHRLCRVAFSNWLVFDAWCVGKGADPIAMSPGRLVAAVYAWRLSFVQKKNDLTKLDNEIFAPPPMRMASGSLRDLAPRGWDERAESAAFEAARSNLNAR